MLLTDFNDTKASISQRLTKKKVFDISGTFAVPVGVNKIYYTGVAAGGRSGETALNPLLNWGSNSTAIGVSADEGYCFATNASINTAAPRIDPAGRKVSLIGITSGALESSVGGGESLAADNGFLFASSASNGTANKYSKDGGLNWLTASPASGGGYSAAAIMPVSQEASVSANRGAFLSTTVGELVVWTGTTWNASTYPGKTFGSMSYVNGYFIATESNATTKTSLYYKSAADAALANGWTAVVIDGTNNVALSDVAYGNGVYVAVGAGGNIYTATTIDGPWTARTSNTTNSISGVKYAGGRWVAVCSAGGDILTATDPTAGWTKTAAVVGAVTRRRKDLHYLATTGHWCVSIDGSNNPPYYSADGSTWTSVPAAISVTAIAATSAGLLCMQSTTNMIVIPDPSKPAYITLSTSGDGGDCRVIRGSTGAELLRLAGGRVGAANLGGDGGSSTGTVMKGGQGAAQDKMAMGPRGTGIYVSAAILGGGICPFLEDLLLNDGMAGIKIVGGGGAYWTAAAFSGGGGSIMAAANAGLVPGQGPGGGMCSSTTGAGGGGEGVVRFPIDVTPGEVLAFGNGLAQTSSSNTYNAQHGFGMIEWEG